MTQADNPSIDNVDGATYRSQDNERIEALFKKNSGSTAPSNTFPFMWWLDTSPADHNLLKQRNAADDGWDTVARIDDDGWRPVGGDAGRLRRITVFDTVGANTYNKPDWLKFAIFAGVGAGGGGGGVTSTTADRAAIASGGGAGGPFKFRIDAGDLSASESVTVGGGGDGGAAGDNDGSNGGSTSVGSFATGTGGAAGESMNNSQNSIRDGGDGGNTTYSGIDLSDQLLPAGTRTGATGHPGMAINGFCANYGFGADSIYGGGGRVAGGNNGSNAGSGARAWGAGGAGARSVEDSPANSGGNGADAIVIVLEYE